MDGELGAKLEAILSDPQQMEKITQMAMGLMSSTATASDSAGDAPSADTPPALSAGVLDSLGDTRLLSALGKAFSGGTDKNRSTALLVAMRPYMRPEKQEKLDRAMKIARMVHIAGAVMKEYGGTNGL